MSESTAAPPSARPSSRLGEQGRPSTKRPRDSLECVVLPARSGGSPSARPPVEIFLGTEPAQYRANRVFVWSIEKVRDPGREVRIYLMSELADFDRRGWTTGFTNFRFAIPAFQSGEGRAIYNDEDQIYLTDPGELFDLDLGDAAHLSISDTESSVMLIDCTKMSDVWTLSDAQHRWKRALLRKASKETGLRGDLEPGWNARDEEFLPGVSHLLHYTTLHTQPWRPFPERFVYQEGSHTDIWHELEREAIENGFELFRRDAPSRAFRERFARQRESPQSEMGSGIGVAGEISAAIDEFVGITKSRTLLELSPDLNGDGEQRPGRFGLDHERRLGLVEWLASEDARGRSTSPDSSNGSNSSFEAYDGVICVDGLEAFPVWDIPWLVESIFARATRFVFVAVRCPESPPRRRFLLPPEGTTHTPDWWRSHLEAASERHPQVSWELMTARGRTFDSDRIHVARGGRRPADSPPQVWTLTDGAPGNETQVQALAGALGWPHVGIRLEGRERLRVPRGRASSSRRALRGEDHLIEKLQPPWPALLIVAGRRVAPVARWVREASRGRTQVVAIGHKAATPVSEVDLAVTMSTAAVFPHPNRFVIDRPLTNASASSAIPVRWRERIDAMSGRRIVLLLGSGTHRLGFDESAAEAIGKLVAESASALGASILISSSRHCASEVRVGCLRGVGKAALVHQETSDQRPGEQAWPAFLEAADLFVYVGLGETTLTEICATGRPVFLAPQLPSRESFWVRLRDSIAIAIVARAEARPTNDRGTARPQQGLELLCARLVDRGWVRPRRDIESLRGRFVRSGNARLLRAPIRAGDLVGFAEPVESDLPRVVSRVRQMLGFASEDEEESRRRRAE